MFLTYFFINVHLIWNFVIKRLMNYQKMMEMDGKVKSLPQFPDTVERMRIGHSYLMFFRKRSVKRHWQCFQLFLPFDDLKWVDVVFICQLSPYLVTAHCLACKFQLEVRCVNVSFAVDHSVFSMLDGGEDLSNTS